MLIEYKHMIRCCVDGYFCIEFIDFMLTVKIFLGCTNLFSLNLIMFFCFERI